MSLQKIFSLFLGVVSIAGLISSWDLPLFTPDRLNMSTGFTPILFSLALLLCAIVFFVLDRSKEKFDFRALFSGDIGKAFVFFLFNILMLILLYLFGVIVGMLIFSILACIGLRRQTASRFVPFSIAWVGIIYVVFVVLLKIPFDRGIIVEMLGYL